jgi:hypothetical protein
MNRIVSRQEVYDLGEPNYIEIMDKEQHHDHEIIETENGVWRWKEDKDVSHFLENISLNDLCPLLKCLGYNQNSEVYRKLYRSMGYSLSGYWGLFYWEVNNEKANEYNPV